jgi:hypothetical protein
MRFFHGTNMVIDTISLTKSRKRVDFGVVDTDYDDSREQAIGGI